jgi:hypothetical protein
MDNLLQNYPLSSVHWLLFFGGLKKTSYICAIKSLKGRGNVLTPFPLSFFSWSVIGY